MRPMRFAKTEEPVHAGYRVVNTRVREVRVRCYGPLPTTASGGGGGNVSATSGSCAARKAPSISSVAGLESSCSFEGR